MKTIFKILFCFIVIIFFLVSCTIEKRIYRSGYNISMKNSKQNQENNEIVNHESKSEQSEKVIVKQSEIETISSENYNPIIEELSASNDKKSIIQKKEKINKLNELKENVLKNSQRLEKTNLKPDENRPYSVAAIAGFICGMIELLFLILLFSGVFELIIFTMIFEAATIILSIRGLVETRKGKKKGKAFSIFGLILGGILVFIGVSFGVYLMYGIFFI